MAAADAATHVVVPSFNTPEFVAFGGSFDSGNVVSIIFTLAFIWWAVYTLIAIYHWARYGRHSWAAAPAIIIHLLVSWWILVYITSGLH